MTALKWVDPPKAVTGPGAVGKWSPVADELRANPGVWALIAEDVATTTAAYLRNGMSPGWVKGDFQVRSVGKRENRSRSDLYARYVGGAK